MTLSERQLFIQSVNASTREFFDVEPLAGQIYSGTRSTLCPRQWSEVFSQDEYTCFLVTSLFKLKLPREEKVLKYLHDQPDWIHLTDFAEAANSMAIPLRIELNVRANVREDVEDASGLYNALSILMLQTGSFLRRWCRSQNGLVVQYPSSVFPGILKDIVGVLLDQLVAIVEEDMESLSLGHVVYAHWLEKLIHFGIAGDPTRIPTADWRSFGLMENLVNHSWPKIPLGLVDFERRRVDLNVLHSFSARAHQPWVPLVVSRSLYSAFSIPVVRNYLEQEMLVERCSNNRMEIRELREMSKLIVDSFLQDIITLFRIAVQKFYRKLRNPSIPVKKAYRKFIALANPLSVEALTYLVSLDETDNSTLNVPLNEIVKTCSFHELVGHIEEQLDSRRQGFGSLKVLASITQARALRTLVIKSCGFRDPRTTCRTFLTEAFSAKFQEQPFFIPLISNGSISLRGIMDFDPQLQVDAQYLERPLRPAQVTVSRRYNI